MNVLMYSELYSSFKEKVSIETRDMNVDKRDWISWSCSGKGRSL